MEATLKEALQQRQHEEDGGGEVKCDKRVLERVLVSEARRVVETSTYGKPELRGKWNHIPELFDPHCDESAPLETN